MKKPIKILVGVTCAFLCLLIGIFVGRNLTRSYIPVQQAINSQGTQTDGETQNKDGRIDLNTATAEQLQLLPGVGEVTAQRIVDYRTEHNGFTSIEELMEIKGIGEKKFAEMKQYVKVEQAYENSGS